MGKEGGVGPDRKGSRGFSNKRGEKNPPSYKKKKGYQEESNRLKVKKLREKEKNTVPRRNIVNRLQRRKAKNAT